MIVIRRFINFFRHGSESRKTRSATDFVSQSKPDRTAEKAATDAVSALVEAALKGGIAEVERLLRVRCVSGDSRRRSAAVYAGSARGLAFSINDQHRRPSMKNTHRLIKHGGMLRVFRAQAIRLIEKMILRLFRGLGAFGGFLALCGWSGMSAAAVIWDYSPGAIGGTGPSDEVAYSNETRFQNFVERFQFDLPAVLTGMDIYSGGPPVFASCGVFPSCGVVGDLVTVRIFRDVAGQPGALLTSFSESISAIDSVGAAPGKFVSFRKHADFTLPVPLLAHSQYWIGLSGSPTNILLMGLLANPPDDAHMWSLYDETPRFNVAIGDMAFRLEGHFPTPVPGAFSLLAIGLTGLGLVRRVLTR